jgi:hypothetical protein
MMVEMKRVTSSKLSILVEALEACRFPEEGYFIFCEGEHMNDWGKDEKGCYSVARRKWFKTIEEAKKEIENPINNRKAIIIPARELGFLQTEWYDEENPR